MAIKKKPIKRPPPKPPVKKPVAKKPEAKKPAPAKVEPKAASTPPAGIGHNSGPRDVGGVAGKRLRSFIDRVIRLEDEKKGIAEDIKEVYSEAKGVGFDVKTLRKIVKIEQADKEKLREEKELLDLYLQAMDPELAELLS